MAEHSTLSDELITLIQSEANNNPAPMKCEIVKVYADQVHADVNTINGVLTYVETISNNLKVGNLGLVIFVNGDLEEYIVITK